MKRHNQYPNVIIHYVISTVAFHYPKSSYLQTKGGSFGMKWQSRHSLSIKYTPSISLYTHVFTYHTVCWFLFLFVCFFFFFFWCVFCIHFNLLINYLNFILSQKMFLIDVCYSRNKPVTMMIMFSLSMHSRAHEYIHHCKQVFVILPISSTTSMVVVFFKK
jgi:hypothetical protein